MLEYTAHETNDSLDESSEASSSPGPKNAYPSPTDATLVIDDQKPTNLVTANPGKHSPNVARQPSTWQELDLSKKSEPTNGQSNRNTTLTKNMLRDVVEEHDCDATIETTDVESSTKLDNTIADEDRVGEARTFGSPDTQHLNNNENIYTNLRQPSTWQELDLDDRHETHQYSNPGSLDNQELGVTADLDDQQSIDSKQSIQSILSSNENGSQYLTALRTVRFESEHLAQPAGGLLCGCCLRTLGSRNSNFVFWYTVCIGALSFLLAILSGVGYHSIGFVYATALFLSTVAVKQEWQNKRSSMCWRTSLEVFHMFFVCLAILCIVIRIIVLSRARDWNEFPESCEDEKPNCCRVTFNDSCNYGGFGYEFSPLSLHFNESAELANPEAKQDEIASIVFDFVEDLFTFPYFGDVVSRHTTMMHVEVLTVVLGFVDDVSISIVQGNQTTTESGTTTGTVSVFIQSKSRLGGYDFGVNGHRVKLWLRYISRLDLSSPNRLLT